MTLPPDIETRFQFHPATDKTGPAHDAVRAKIREVADWLYIALPDSREKSLAMTTLQETMMWANASIAIHGVDPQ